MNFRTVKPRSVILLHGWYWSQLSLRIFLAGPDKRFFCVARHLAPSDLPHFDVEPEVRELILEEVRFDHSAQWSDPRERLGLQVSA